MFIKKLCHLHSGFSQSCITGLYNGYDGQTTKGKEQEQKVIGRQGWNGTPKYYLTENAPFSFKSKLILL